MLNVNKIHLLTDEHWKLLLLADPSKKMIEVYIYKSTVYEARIENSIVGILVLFRNSDIEIEIKNVAVDPFFQGRGIGKELILLGIRESKKIQYQKISICTGNSSTHQLVLYQSCGFNITDTICDFFIHHYEEEIWENGIQCKDLIKLELNLS